MKNYEKSVISYEEDTYFRFQNFKRLLKAPFTIYDDFESILKSAIANQQDGPSCKIYQDKLFTVMVID